MTVSAQNSYISYTGNGSTTAYSWPYKLFAATDLKVYTVVIATGVETLLPLALELHHNKSIKLKHLIAAITSNPARILGINKGSFDKDDFLFKLENDGFCLTSSFNAK